MVLVSINDINGDQYDSIDNKSDKLLDLFISNFECEFERNNNSFMKEDSDYHPVSLNYKRLC